MAKGRITIDSERCKGCGFCAHFCPKECIAIGDKTNSRGNFYVTFSNPEPCTGCTICAVMCPDFAIEVYRR